MRRDREAFTLIELAIVVVIIALLIGGIAVGQNMLRSSQLRSAVEDIDRYRQAVSRFADKYYALPGDMPDATDYWGTDPGGCVGVGVPSSPKRATCNGNGDGLIKESFRVWQHLANAEMIQGLYSGTSNDGGSGEDMAPGINLPKTAISGATIKLYVGATSGTYLGWDITDPINEHAFYLMSAQYAILVSPQPILEPTEAMEIDKKTDDGKPAYGIVKAPHPDFPCAGCNDECVTANTAAAAEYDTSNTGRACSLVFKAFF